MAKSQNHYMEQKKIDTKEYTYDSICINSRQAKTNLRQWKSSVVAKVWVGD